MSGVYKGLVRALKLGGEAEALLENLESIRFSSFAWIPPSDWTEMCLQALEGMITDGWVRAELDPSKACLPPRREWQGQAKVA